MVSEDLIVSNQKLVYSVISKLFPAQRWNEEVESVGMLGLIKAGKNFENENRAAFSTYAFCVIRNEIVNYLRSEKKYTNTLSLDEPVGTEEDTEKLTLGDSIGDSSSTESVMNKIELEELMTPLNERDKTILLMRLDGYSNEEIAKTVSLSKRQVQRILNNIGAMIKGRK